MKYKCDDCGQPTDNMTEFDVGEHHYEIHYCDKCREKMQRIEDWQNEKLRTDTMICPWCEQEFEWEENIYEEGSGVCTCPYCENEFEYECEHSVHWTTRKPEDLYREDEEDE